MRRVLRAAAAAGLAAGLAAAVVPRRLRGRAAAVAAANGAIGAWTGVYRCDRPAGAAAFVLDATWNLPGAAAGLLAHAVAGAAASPGYRPDLARDLGFHVYEDVATPRRGFALTWGNVVLGAGGDSGLDPTTGTGRARLRLLTRHEALHVWQQRVLGPLYPLLYGGWAVTAAIAAGVVAAVERRPVGPLVIAWAYYGNPFERAAYRRAGDWPPPWLDPALLPRCRPCRPSDSRRPPLAP